jgi:hypothetical protein
MKIDPQPYSAIVGRFLRLITAATSIMARLNMPSVPLFCTKRVTGCKEPAAGAFCPPDGEITV